MDYAAGVCDDLIREVDRDKYGRGRGQRDAALFQEAGLKGVAFYQDYGQHDDRSEAAI